MGQDMSHALFIQNINRDIYFYCILMVKFMWESTVNKLLDLYQLYTYQYMYILYGRLSEIEFYTNSTAHEHT